MFDKDFIPEVVKRLVEQIKEFTDIAVIGLSGGADSTLVAILCKLALGSRNVYGIQMPATDNDKKTFNKDSQDLIFRLGIMGMTIDQKSMVDSFKNTITDILYDHENLSDKAIGNIKARARMTTLYAVCEALSEESGKRVRVIGTDNASENFIGYFTKYGDGGVDCNPIGELFKSEVYQLLDYFKEQNIITEENINRTPSAGLWEGQTDEGELGFTYDDLEKCIKFHYMNLDKFIFNEEVKIDKAPEHFNTIMKMHHKNMHKNFNPPIFSYNEYFNDNYREEE